MQRRRQRQQRRRERWCRQLTVGWWRSEGRGGWGAWRGLLSAPAGLLPPSDAPVPAPLIFWAVCAGEDDTPRCGLGRQVQLLYGRSWRQVSRDKPTNIGRAMSQISSAVVFAAIYWRMGK